MDNLKSTIPSLHILGSRQFGGADQFYVRLVKALHEAGQTVVAIHRPHSPVARALQDFPIEQHSLPLANQWDLWSAWQIKRIVEASEPCIVQTYMGRATRLTRLPRSSKAVHIARLGGFYKIDGYYRHAHAWVGNTRGICDYLVREGLPAHRVFQIGNFVPYADRPTPELRQSLRERHGIPDEAFVVFSLGRLVEKKGFDDLLRAYGNLPPKLNGQPLLLLIAGEGPEHKRLKALSEDLDLGNRMRWLGWQKPDEFYALSDLFVCPSRHEPLGNVILEAWSFGLPVVSTATDGAQELIKDEVSGLLTPPGNVTQLAWRIHLAITESDATRRALSDAGRKLLRHRYSREAVVGAYLDLYRDLISMRTF
jgi:glycosyltransferase involved in cell wall biosynthesis